MDKKQTKTVTLSDVNAVIDAAPLKILLKMKERIDARIQSMESTDTERDVMRALMMNRSMSSGADKLSEAPMPSSPMSSLAPPPSDRSALSSMMPMDGEMPDTSSLRMQLEKMETKGPPSSEMMEMNVVFLYADNYGNGMAAIKDEEVIAQIKTMHADCKNKGWYFPYGFGNNNDLLKIKNFKRERKGENCKIKVHFKQWNNQGKQGYSCYYNK